MQDDRPAHVAAAELGLAEPGAREHVDDAEPERRASVRGEGERSLHLTLRGGREAHPHERAIDRAVLACALVEGALQLAEPGADRVVVERLGPRRPLARDLGPILELGLEVRVRLIGDARMASPDQPSAAGPPLPVVPDPVDEPPVM